MAAVQGPLLQTKLQFVVLDDKVAQQKLTKHDRKAIQSHVMLEYRRKERLSRTLKYQQQVKNSNQVAEPIYPKTTPSPPSEQQRTPDYNKPNEPDQELGLFSTSLVRSLLPIRQAAPTRARVQERRCHFVVEDSSSDEASDFSSPPSPTIYLGGGSGDPFSSSIIRLDIRRHALIRYFVSDCLPSLYVMEDSNYRKWTRMPSLEDEVSRCIRDSTRCYSTLAMASSFAELARYNKSQSSTALVPSQDTLYFKMRAVNELKKAVASNAPKFALIWSVIMLTACECFIGNVQAQRIHLRGLSQLLESLGGFKVLPPFLLDSAVITDINSAIPLLAKPIFPLTWAPESLPKSISDQIFPVKFDNRIRNINLRFETPPNRTILPGEMLGLLRDVRNVTIMAKHSIVFGASKQTDLAWLNYQILATEHRLLSLSFNVNDPDQALLKCVQITTLLFINTSDVDQMPWQALQSLIPELEEALHHTDLANFWGSHSDILFWVLFFGCYAGEGMPESFWFEVQVASLASHMQLTEWEDVEALMLEFFYVDCIHNCSFIPIWKRVASLMGKDHGMKEDGSLTTSLQAVNENCHMRTNIPKKPQTEVNGAEVGKDIRVNAMLMRVTTNCHPRGVKPATIPKSLH
jgi:hypothetical protein